MRWRVLDPDGTFPIPADQHKWVVTVLATLGTAFSTFLIGVASFIILDIVGLLTGNQGRGLAMSVETHRHVDLFWRLVDELLNAVLFVLVRLEVLAMTFRLEHLLAIALMVPAALLARFVSVGLPVTALRSIYPFPPYAVMIMTWGGLRGGISVAMALSLHHGEARSALLAITYGIVVFSTLVQATTIKHLVRRSNV